MKRITDINELKQGDIIVKIDLNNLTFIEFLCIHPRNENYSLFLDSNQDGMAKFYNHRLEIEEWYLYSDNERIEFWNEIRIKQIEKLQSRIAFYKSLLNK